ncbi:hypothetical protein ACIQ9J_35125 [Streptomyces sp. NPDC094153]|uniref:hypothetical protein n=1 Tax=Streptomyces sp. NPDC094153 TaxID=3366058 RepID=UPI0037F2C0A3
MAKGPAVIGVLTEPPAPTWWMANRHKVLFVIGLLVGYWLGTHTADASPARPEPGPTAPAITHAPARGAHALVQVAA